MLDVVNSLHCHCGGLNLRLLAWKGQSADLRDCLTACPRIPGWIRDLSLEDADSQA